MERIQYRIEGKGDWWCVEWYDQYVRRWTAIYHTSTRDKAERLMRQMMLSDDHAEKVREGHGV